MMHVTMLGVNHRTADVDLREQLVLSGKRLFQAFDEFHSRYPEAEVVFLSTCNRTEVYITKPSNEKPSTDDLKKFLTSICQVESQLVNDAWILSNNDEAIMHLFRVASGLESMVLGEPQVLGQVKKAYETACAHQTVGPVLHRVFQQAIAAAKRARTDTQIGKGRASVGSVAVDFAKQIFERFDDKTIVSIGAGELAKPILHHLKALNPEKLFLTNRSLNNAHLVAQQLGLAQTPGGVKPFDQLENLLVEADIVLTCTSATDPIITTKRFKPILKKRRHRPVFIIDTAIPRNVEATVGRLHNVYVYNIDDLQHVIAQTHTMRSNEVHACETLLNKAVSTCISQIQNQNIGQLIRSIKHKLHQLGLAEQQRTLKKLSSVTQADIVDSVSQIMEEHTHRLINKILHPPVSKINNHPTDITLELYADALRLVFGVDETNPNAQTQSDQCNPVPQPKPSNNGQPITQRSPIGKKNQ